jgi:LAGLIDADG DNA endonuclease family.
VPVLIHRFLSERSLAYWFMDDGSAKWKRSRVLLLNTQGFTQSDVERLADAIRDKYAVQTYLRRQAEGWQIAVSGSSRGRFEEIVKPYLVSSMMYKIERA